MSQQVEAWWRVGVNDVINCFLSRVLVTISPENASMPEEKAIKDKYSRMLGSAADPVLPGGNSDRRAVPVKDNAKKHPHKIAPWTSHSKSHASSMTEGDFFGVAKSDSCGQ